jgi:hypothetical protein
VVRREQKRAEEKEKLAQEATERRERKMQEAVDAARKLQEEWDAEEARLRERERDLERREREVEMRERGVVVVREGSVEDRETVVEIKPEPVSYKFSSLSPRDAHSAIQDYAWPPIDYSANIPNSFEIQVDEMEVDPPVEEERPEDVLQAADGEMVSTYFIP